MYAFQCQSTIHVILKIIFWIWTTRNHCEMWVLNNLSRPWTPAPYRVVNNKQLLPSSSAVRSSCYATNKRTPRRLNNLSTIGGSSRLSWSIWYSVGSLVAGRRQRRRASDIADYLINKHKILKLLLPLHQGVAFPDYKLFIINHLNPICVFVASNFNGDGFLDALYTQLPITFFLSTATVTGWFYNSLTITGINFPEWVLNTFATGFVLKTWAL